MNNLIAYKKFPTLTDEEIAEIYANAPKSDDEIDYSDIPPTSDEQLARMKANRLRRKLLKAVG